MGTETVWRPVDWFVIGEKANFDTTMKGTQVEVKSTTGFPGAKGLHVGSWIKGTHDSGMNFNKISLGGNVHHESGANTAGASVDFNQDSKAVKTTVGFQNK